MAKKSDRQPEPLKPPKPAYALAGQILGGAQIALGLFIMWAMSANPPRLQAPLWVRTAGLVLVVVGALLWYLSQLPKDQALEWIKSGLFALGLALLIRWPIAEPYRIPSGSMEPTLHGDERIGRGDRVFVNKWIYGVRVPFMNKRLWYGRDPQRWDIVVFKTVEENAQHGTLVKRIVGMPGERIHIQDGKVYANDQPLEIPPSLPENMHYTSPSNPFTGMMYGILPEDEYAVVPEGYYLVMGDNSGNSRDGRYFGWMPNEHLVGRVACIWWPPPRWRDFTGFSKTLWWRTVIALLGLWLVVRLFIGRSWAVPRPSGKGVDHLFVNFAAFGLRVPFSPWWIVRWGQPQRGALVMYQPQGEAAPDGALLIGRVAGLPGEKVTIENGKLAIDGAPVSAPSALAEGNFSSTHPEAIYGRSRSKQHMQVPDGQYFILSESEGPAEEALDSRILGWIPQQTLLGKATAVWWPVYRARRM